MAVSDLRIDDALIRAAVCREYMASQGGKLVGEWNIGLSRVDLARIEPSYLHGIEIKSPCDSLVRLSQQARDYGRVFDVCTLVAARDHVGKAAVLIPEWWGIREVIPSGRLGQGGEIMLLDRRKPGINPDVDVRSLAWLLWCDELRALLTAHKLITIRRESKARMIEIVERNFGISAFRPLVIAALLARTSWRRDLEEGATLG